MAESAERDAGVTAQERRQPAGSELRAERKAHQRAEAVGGGRADKE
jgi:hypothetical protein